MNAIERNTKHLLYLMKLSNVFDEFRWARPTFQMGLLHQFTFNCNKWETINASEGMCLRSVLCTSGLPDNPFTSLVCMCVRVYIGVVVIKRPLMLVSHWRCILAMRRCGSYPAARLLHSIIERWSLHTRTSSLRSSHILSVTLSFAYLVFSTSFMTIDCHVCG